MTYFKTGYYLVCSQLSVENVCRRYFCQSPARIINTSIITILVNISDLVDCSHRWPARDVGPGLAELAEGQRLIESHTDYLDRDKLISLNIYNWWENCRQASAFFRFKLKYPDGHTSINTAHRVILFSYKQSWREQIATTANTWHLSPGCLGCFCLSVDGSPGCHIFPRSQCSQWVTLVSISN